MARLIIPVGIPGCGKSTWGERFFPGRTVSSDAIRAEMGDVYDQTRNKEVFATFHRRIKEGLLSGSTMYADATNLNGHARANLRQVARDCGAKIDILFFDNADQAVVRNLKRERVVPQEAMVRMLNKYEQTHMDLIEERVLYDSVTIIESVS